MDLLNAKSIKNKKIAKKLRVHTLSDLFFRAIEILVVTVIVARICYELLDSNISVDFLVNRHLAFVLGNVIVVALIAKSGVFKNQEVDPKCGFYEEFVRESSISDRISEYAITYRGKQSNEKKQSTIENRATQSTTENREKQSNQKKQSTTENRAKQNICEKFEKQSTIENKPTQGKYEKIKKQSITENRAKQSIYEKVKKQSTAESRGKQSICEHIDEQSIITESKAKQSIVEEKRERSENDQRSKSENHEGIKKRSTGRLRRSETSSDTYDNDDELRSKIESFIARQRRNQVEEEFCVSLD